MRESKIRCDGCGDDYTGDEWLVKRIWITFTLPLPDSSVHEGHACGTICATEVFGGSAAKFAALMDVQSAAEQQQHGGRDA